MKSEALNKFEKDFRTIVRKDPQVQNAYLLIHSQKSGIHLHIAEGETGDDPADFQQPNYMASVGKMFTSTIIAMLVEQQKLSVDDHISDYLDEQLLRALHVFRGTEYTHQLTVKHLLKQTSGLFDNFWPLLEKLQQDDSFCMTPRDAIMWGKENLESTSAPGKKVSYTDTNYHLLGLIAESVTGKPFHTLLHEFIFSPLSMEHSFMLGYSEPAKPNSHPVALFSMHGTVLNHYPCYGSLDYAGGGVVAPLEDLLKFMKALTAGELISREMLNVMIQDSDTLYPGMDYGYGIWKLKSIPLLMPKSYYCWGCVGATGAFMFYHPAMDTYLIGNFNDESYKIKAVRFMLKLVKGLLR